MPKAIHILGFSDAKGRVNIRIQPTLLSVPAGSRIEGHAVFTSNTSVPLCWEKGDRGNYREQDVEKLLDEAADYLERALRSQTEWREIYEKSFRTYLEVTEGIKTSEISIREDRANINELTLLEAESQKAALSSRISQLNSILRDLLNDANLYAIPENSANRRSLP